MEGYKAPKQCMQKSYTPSAAMSRRAEPLISRLSIPLSWCVMSILHKFRKKKKSFCKFFKREPFCAVFKTSFSFFWYLPASSGETCLSSSLFHFEFHGDTFLARLSGESAFMQSWKDMETTASSLEKQEAWWQRDFFPWNVEGWLERMRQSTVIILPWGPGHESVLL